MEIKKGYIGVYLYKTAYGIKDEIEYYLNSGQFLKLDNNTTNIDFSEIKDIFNYNNHLFFTKQDNTVWANGSNSYGCLGTGDTADKTKPVQLNITNIKDILTRCETTVFLKNDGTISGCGQNNGGQLGLGHNKTVTKITELPITNVKKALLTQFNLVILKNDGTVWASGSNWDYFLCKSDDYRTYNFIKLPIENVIDIYDTESGLLFLKEDNTLYACGYYSSGIGLPRGKNYSTPTKVDIDNIKKIYTGYEASMIIKNDNSVWVSGEAYYGKLGIKDAINNAIKNKLYYQDLYTKIDIDGSEIKDIVIDQYCTYILKNDHTILGCGNNQYKMLGNMDEYEIINKNNYPVVEEFQPLKLPKQYKYDKLIGSRISNTMLFSFPDYVYPTAKYIKELKKITSIQLTNVMLDISATSQVSLNTIINDKEPITLTTEIIGDKAEFTINPELLNIGINTLKVNLIDSNDVSADVSELKILKTNNNELILFPKGIVTKEVLLDKTYDRIKVDTIKSGNIKLIYKIKEEYIENENIAEDLESDKAQLIILLDNDTEVKCYQQKAFNNIKVYF